MKSPEKIFSKTGEVMLTAREAGERLSCAPDYVGKLCREGKLECVRGNNAWFVDEQSLFEFEKAREIAKAERARELAEARRLEGEEYRKANALVAASDVGTSSVSRAARSTHLMPYAASMALGALLFAGSAAAHAGLFDAGGKTLAAAVAHIDSPFFGTGAPQVGLPDVSAAGDAIGNFFAGFFAKQPVAQAPADSSSQTQTQNAPVATASSTPQASPARPQGTTIVQQITNTYPVIERTVERVVASQGVSEATLTTRLQELTNALTSKIYEISQQSSNNTVIQLAPSQRIDRLTGTQLFNVSVSGISGITDDDIPNDITASNYVPLSGGTLTGTLTLAGSLNGPLQANNGVVSATSSVGTVYGGTGITSYATGDIIYASGSNTLSVLAAGANGRVLKLSGGVPVWGVDNSGGGGGSGAWATTTDELAIYPADIAQVVLVGNDATTTTGYIFEVTGNALFRNALTSYGAVTASRFVATSTTASTFLNASSSLLSVTNKAYFGGTATSSFDSAGVLTLASALGVASGGTGATSLTGLLKGNGTSAFTAAVAGSDYVSPGTATTYTSLQQFANASTSLFSSYGPSYFGATATSSFSSAGVLTLAGITSSILSTNGSGAVGALTVGSSLTLSGNTLSVNTGGANIYTALQTFSAGASTTNLSALDTLYIGRTATTTIRGDGVASTLPYASSTAITVSGTGYFGTASTTNLTVSGIPTSILATNGSGAVGALSVGSGLTFSGNTLSINSAGANTYTALQQFANASTSLFSSYGPSYFGATATTTIDSAGNVSVAGTLTVTGQTTLVNASTSAFSSNSLAVGGTATTTISTAGALTTPSLTLSGVTGSTQCLRVNSSGTVSGTGSDCGSGSGSFSYTSTTNYGALANATSTPIWFQSGLQASSTSQLAYASSTALSVSGIGYFGTASTSNLTISGIQSSLLKTGASGIVAAAAAGSDYVAPGTATTYTALQQFANASSSLFSVTGTAYFGGTATTTINSAGTVAIAGNLTGAGLSTCSGSTEKLLWSGGQFSCGTDQNTGGGGGSFPFSASTNYGQVVYATSTPTLWFQSGFFASSTSHLVYASTTAITVSGTGFFGTASTTNLTISGVPSSLLKTDASGVVSAATAGADYVAPGTAASYTALQQFNGGASTTNLSVYDTIYIGRTSTSTLTSSAINLASGGVFQVNGTTVLSATTLGTNVVNSSLTAVGALNSGSITSGFGSIDIGGDALTAGAGSLSSLTVSGQSTLANASSTMLSVFNNAWFGASATSSFSSTGALTLASALAVTSGGTGATTLNDLITLGTHTSGNYVATLGSSGSITVGSSGSESAAVTANLNMANANSWTALQQFANASSSLFSVTGTAYFGGLATTTIDSSGNLAVAGNFTGAGLSACNGSTQKVLWTGGQFSCGTDLNTGGSSGTFSFDTNYGVIAAATSSALWAQAGIFASSTSHFVRADFVEATSTSLSVAGITSLAGNVGLGTTSPSSKLSIAGGNLLQIASGNPTIATSVPSSSKTYQAAVAGRYLYTAEYGGGLKIQDISNPKAPTTTASLSLSGNALSVTVAGRYAYVGTSVGVNVVDVSNAKLPVLVGTYSIDFAYGLALSGKYLYVGDYNGAAVRILDISDPRLPLLAGNYPITSGAPYGLYVGGKYLYIADQGILGLKIVDISNPVVPSTVGTYATTTAATGVFVSGRYAYVTDATAGFYILDVGNPASPAWVSTYRPSATTVYYGVVVAGDYAYIGDHGGNMVVLDVSNPVTPTLVGSVAAGAANGIAISGKYAYVAGDTSGVYTVDINGAKLPAAHIGSLESSNLNVSEDVSVGNNISVGGGIDVGLGGIFSRGTIAAFVASSTQTNPVVASFMGGNVGIGTTTPYARLTIHANPTDTVNQHLFAIGSSTSAYATSTLFSINNQGNIIGAGTLAVTGSTTLSSLLNVGGALNANGAATVLGQTTLAAASSTALSALDYIYVGRTASTTITSSAINLASGGVFQINGTTVLSASTLGSGVTASSLTSVGTLTSLTVSGNTTLANATSTSAFSAAFLGNVASFGQTATTTITSGGFLGVGTSTPWAQLSVNPNGISGPAFAVGSSSATSFIIDNGGRVGVGTTNPWGKLAVSASSISSDWAAVGSGLSISTASFESMAALSPNRIAFIDAAGTLRAYGFDGSTWAQVGNTLSVSVAAASTLTALSPNRVAFIDGFADALRVYEFNGTTWVAVGSSLSVASVSAPALAALSPNRVAFIDATNDSLRVYDFNGSTWSQAGSSLAISTVTAPALAALSPNRVAYIDGTNDSLRVYEFDGATWSQVGSSLAVATVGTPVLASLSPNRVAFIDSSNDALRTYEFNGGTWSQVGNSLAVATVGTPALAALSPNRVAFIDDSNKSLTTYQWSTPLLYIANGQDYPYFAVSDAGYTTAEALGVRTELRVGQSATSTAASSSPALIVNGTGVFSGKVGIGTTTPWATLSINGSVAQTSPLLNIASTTGASFLSVAGDTGFTGFGTTTPWALVSINPTAALGAAPAFVIGSSTATSFIVDNAGRVGIGTTSPFARFTVTNTASAAQSVIAYDQTRYARLYSDTTGDLGIQASGQDVYFNNDNVWACTGPSDITTNNCLGGVPTGQGNFLAEGGVGIGTTTALGIAAGKYKLAIETGNSGDSAADFLQIASTTNQGIFVVNSNGRVGIGTSTPFARLAVGAGGAITTTENPLTYASTITVNWLDGNQQKVILTGSPTINFSNYVAGQILRLVVCQDSSTRTVTWQGVNWQGGTAPTLSTTANKCDLIALIATNATSTLQIFGTAALQF